MIPLRRLLLAAGRRVAACSAPAAAACIEKGGYPFESGTEACLPGLALDAAIDLSIGSTPPANSDGQGAYKGHAWLDMSTTPYPTKRICAVAQCTGGTYHSNEWRTDGWWDLADNLFISAEIFKTLTANLNAALLPSPLSGTVAQIGNADGQTTRLELDSWGAPAIWTTRRADGTQCRADRGAKRRRASRQPQFLGL